MVTKLRKLLLANELDAFVSVNAPTVRYFTGFVQDALPAVTLIFQEKVFLIAPDGSVADVEVIPYPCFSAETFVDEKKAICDALNRSDLIEMIKGIRVGAYSLDFPSWLHAQLIALGAEINFVDDKILDFLITKNDKECKKIQQALKLNRKAYDVIRDEFQVGMTEMDCYNLISNCYNKNAGTPIKFISDIVSGERAAEISGSATLREAKTGDTLIVDLLPKLDGYWCDTTRTFFLGEPDAEKEKAYISVIKALRAGEAMLKPGVKAEDVYSSVMDSLEKSGFKDCMPHHAGHGIGTSGYERPYFIHNAPEILKAGMVVTLEPGIYMENQWGIRVENNYKITADGCENIFPYTENIEDFIL